MGSKNTRRILSVLWRRPGSTSNDMKRYIKAKLIPKGMVPPWDALHGYCARYFLPSTASDFPKSILYIRCAEPASLPLLLFAPSATRTSVLFDTAKAAKFTTGKGNCTRSKENMGSSWVCMRALTYPCSS